MTIKLSIMQIPHHCINSSFIVKNIFTTLFFVISLYANAIEPNIGNGISNDQKFKHAQELANSGKHAEARTLCLQILKNQPDYLDADVLMGRTFGWDHQYDSARIVLKSVLNQKKNYMDGINALIDIENWDMKKDSALYYCNYGLSFFPNDETLLLKKAKILVTMDKTEDALTILRQLLIINPSNEGALNIKKKLRSSWSNNKISVQHSFDYFHEPWVKRWHITSLEYTQETPYGLIIPRISIGDLVNDNEFLYQKNDAFQFEIDLYPKISKWNYAYISYGYSPSVLFPKNRAAVEFYQKLPKTFEISLGLRFMQFNASVTPNKIYIFTGSLSKYYKQYWFSFKPFLSSKSYGLSQSYNLYIRRYIKNSDNYFTFMTGFGNSPDDPANNFGYIEQYKYRTYKVSAEYQDFLSKKWIYKINVGYNYEEFKTSSYRSALNIIMRFTYLF